MLPVVVPETVAVKDTLDNGAWPVLGLAERERNKVGTVWELKLAAIVLLLSIVNMTGLDELAISPVQEVKTYPELGVAVKVTEAPCW